MKTLFSISVMFFLVSLNSCKEAKNNVASGSFEAQEIIVSAEANGPILQFQVAEGQLLSTGEILGFIDTTSLFLKKKQIATQIEAVKAKEPNISIQLDVLRASLKTLLHEKKRMQNLIVAQAAPTKQLDDIESQIQLIEKQISAQSSSLINTNNGIEKEIESLKIQQAQIQDQINRCYITSPIRGVVLSKITEVKEMATMGKPLFKIASLDTLTLRAYVTGDQLAPLKLNQSVTVRTDNGQGKMINHLGNIIWISSQAEFTPKTIQTQNERANLVYAVKIKVPNNGQLKLGMYGEISWQ